MRTCLRSGLAEPLLGKLLRKHSKTAPKLVARLSEEIRHRPRVARLFPSEASCLRLVSAVVMEIAEDWQTAKKR